MGKYDPLGDYLANLPPETREVRLSFEQIEEIIGEALPPNMLVDTRHWTNIRSKGPSVVWLAAGWRTTRADLASRRVTLVRADAVLAGLELPGRERAENNTSRHGRRRGKYDPLSDYLASLPLETREVRLSFEEIERIIGGALPPCMLTGGSLWTNIQTSGPSRAWLAAGWRSRGADMESRRVTLVRADLVPPHADLVGRGMARRSRGGDRRGKYEALGEYFRTVPAEKCEITLAFSDIEKIIGCELPRTAYENRVWWTNTRHYPHAREWLSAGWELTEIDMEDTLVAFARVGTEIHRRRSTAGARRGAYSRLREFLKSLPTEQKQLALTFDEVERIMQSRLTSRARTDANWWTNANSQQQTRCWREAGWEVQQAYPAAGIVVLRRRGSDPIRSIPNLVRALLEPCRRVSLPGPKQLCQWIRLCKQLGWYFEGTVLYEKTGDAFGGLSEAEAEAVYEDYQTCKRELKRYERPLPCGATRREGSEC